MRKKELSDENLAQVRELRQAGHSWLAIQEKTGVERRLAKRTYNEWLDGRSLNELKQARVNVATEALSEHLDSLVKFAERLIDHLEQKHLTLSNVRYLVLDEADRMLDMGFEPQIRKVLVSVPRKRQTFLFSATMPEKIAKITRKYMSDPERIEVAPAGTAAELVKQEGYVIERHDRMRLLVKLLSDSTGKILVFSRTKFGAQRISAALRQAGFASAELHSDRSQAQRRQALQGFKSDRFRILVATDIASRGIDVSDIESVDADNINIWISDNSLNVNVTVRS